MITSKYDQFNSIVFNGDGLLFCVPKKYMYYDPNLLCIYIL